MTGDLGNQVPRRVEGHVTLARLSELAMALVGRSRARYGSRLPVNASGRWIRVRLREWNLEDFEAYRWGRVEGGKRRTAGELEGRRP